MKRGDEQEMSEHGLLTLTVWSGAAGVPHTSCRKMSTMPTRRARALESKGTEIAAWLHPSTLFFLTCCPRSSSPLHAARVSSASTAAQG